jgi:putative glycosyltransferase (TIGR04372 family)
MLSVSNQLRDIWQGGWPVFARKIKTALKSRNRFFLYLLNAFWAIPILIVVRVIRPFLRVRVGIFNFGRIGHFAADVGQRKAESIVNRSQKNLDFWYLPDDSQCSNVYWAKITRRWFRAHSLVRHLVFWNSILPFGKSHSLNSGGTHRSRDVNGFLERAKLRMPSTLSEELEARNWMAQWGWKEGDPFVCLMVRDSEYLRKLHPEFDCSYHDYRDSDIQNYRKAIKYLNSQGAYVFRMGQQMGSRVEYNNEKFIDYAFCNSKSAFLDIWLFANCNLCITTGSGPDLISDVFRRKTLLINYLPLHGLWSWSNTITYPKSLVWKSTGKTLTLTEYLDHAHYDAVAYANAGIDVSELNDDQIYEAVNEGWSSAIGARTLTDQERYLHEQYVIHLKSHCAFQHFHKFLHPDSRLASAFLSDVGEVFLK